MRYSPWGVYLDDFSSGTTIFGNIFVRNQNGGVNVHSGKNNIIENNIFVESANEQMRLQPHEGDFMKGNRFVHNIVYYTHPDVPLVSSWDKRRDRFAEWDGNLYFIPGADLATSQVKSTPEGTYAQWLAAGFDAHSKVADPLFVDPAKDDYRLKPTSPAFALGFQPIPIERIGAKGKR